jgi:hypothetical protein
MQEVKFTASQMKIVDKFESSLEKQAQDWDRDEFSEIKKHIKNHYITEQNYTCFFCRQRFVNNHGRVWDIEHILSRSAYPKFMFHPKNLCITCPECNMAKGDKSSLSSEKIRVLFPSQSSSYSIIHPHFDIYEEHIEATVPGKMYRLRSKKGRTTYRTYGLDRFLMISERSNAIDDQISHIVRSIASCDDINERKSLVFELIESALLEYPETLGAARTIEIIKDLKKT